MSNLGRLDEAVVLSQRAIALDPLRVATHQNYATLSHRVRALREAEAALRKAIELQPQSAQTYMWLAIIQILRGKPGTAVELAKQETDPFWRTYALALAQFAQRPAAEADAALKKLIDEDADGSGSQIARSMPCARAGENVRMAGARLGHARRGVTGCCPILSCAPTSTTPASSPSRKRSESCESRRQMNRGSLFAELWRRNVIRMA